MTLELSVPATPVRLAPGVRTRVAVELRNPTGVPAVVHVEVVSGRAAAWTHPDPAPVTVDAYAETGAEVVLEAPADQPVSSSLVPFTVRAIAADTGEPTGFATGLIAVAVPVPVTGELVTREGRADTYDLRLSNDGTATAAVRVEAKLDPPAGTVTAEPAAIMIESGARQVVTVRAKPSRPVLGQQRTYFVLVTVTDAYDPDRPPLISATGSGTRRPRVSSWLAGMAAILLTLGATATIWFAGWTVPLPGARKPSAASTATATAAAVRAPYASIEVFPRTGAGDGGRGAADAAAARLATLGLTVRVVDSRDSDLPAGGGAGFWVLVRDGFADVPAAEAFCTRWRAVAPKCRVRP